MLNRLKKIVLQDDLEPYQIKPFVLESVNCCKIVDDEEIHYVRSTHHLEPDSSPIPQEFDAEMFSLSSQLRNGITPQLISQPYFKPAFDDVSQIVNALQSVHDSTSNSVVETTSNSTENSSVDNQ